MKKKPLHNLSHFISRIDKNIVLSVYIKSEEKRISLKRGLFLANVECVDLDYKTTEGDIRTLQITFTTLKQLEYTIPIINNTMKENGFGYPFYYIDNNCKEYFK